MSRKYFLLLTKYFLDIHHIYRYLMIRFFRFQCKTSNRQSKKLLCKIILVRGRHNEFSDLYTKNTIDKI